MRMQGGMGDDGMWDLRQSRRNALGGAGMGMNHPITLDGTGSGAEWQPPVASTAPTLPTHPGMAMPVGGIGMDSYAGDGLGGGMQVQGPITPRMVNPRRNRGNLGW